jgi:hypothetical protein
MGSQFLHRSFIGSSSEMLEPTTGFSSGSHEGFLQEMDDYFVGDGFLKGVGEDGGALFASPAKVPVCWRQLYSGFSFKRFCQASHFFRGCLWSTLPFSSKISGSLPKRKSKTGLKTPIAFAPSFDLQGKVYAIPSVRSIPKPCTCA